MKGRLYYITLTFVSLSCIFGEPAHGDEVSANRRKQPKVHMVENREIVGTIELQRKKLVLIPDVGNKPLRITNGQQANLFVGKHVTVLVHADSDGDFVHVHRIKLVK